MKLPPSARCFLAQVGITFSLVAVGIGVAHGASLFYVTEATAYVDQISSAGVVSTYATFSGSSDLPEGLALNSQGVLYVGNAGQGLIWKVAPGGGTPTPFASTGNQQYSYGLALGSDGNLFAAIVGGSAGQIDKITPAGVVTTFASLPASAAPFGLVFDNSGNLFAADAQLKRIYKITPAGGVSTFVTFPSSATPTGLAFDAGGNLFAADFGGAIYEITPAGAVSTFATLPSGYGLKGLAFDNSGNLYVAEQNRNVVGKIAPGGSVTDFANVFAPQFLLPIPEPSTLALVSLAALLFASRRGRQDV
jgi:streptogramin lyase